MKQLITITTSAILLIGSNALFAHHSSSPHFDQNKTLTINGVVTKFRFVNPHAWVYLDVVDQDGNTAEWNCELGAASVLSRAGWSEGLLKPGTEMTIEGIAARRDAHGCSFRSGELVNGTTLGRNGVVEGSAALVASVAKAAEDTATETVASAPNDGFLGAWQTAPRARGGRPGGAGPGGSGTFDDQIAELERRFGEHMTDAGRAAALAYDQRFDDPALVCSASSIIRGWGEPGGISEVTKSGDQIIIKHEYMDVTRVINMDTREHPADFEHSMTGHSVGWYEGDELVIETARFKAGVLTPHPGLLHSEDMLVTERLSLSEDGNQLVKEYSVVDPQYLSKPLTGRSAWNRSNIALPQYNCVELGGVSNIRRDGD